MELFKNANYDFLGKKWPFIIASLVLTLAGLVSLLVKGGPKYGIDFRGGAQITVKFNGPPPVEKLRSVLGAKLGGAPEIQEVTGENQVIIGTELAGNDNAESERARQSIVETLAANFPAGPDGKAPYQIGAVEVVGPKMGAELRQQALYVVLAALAGMLIYIAFRFEWIYGVAAVLAVFHDTIITVGLFSIFDKEITLTVVAALLTLVGYSMNDTIVVFDRIRENLKLNKRAPYEELVNSSINQTLSRTILTSGLTFLTALALWLFGGPVLNGFSLALVIGIIIGTYSSVFIASPILIFWRNWREQRKRQNPQVSATGTAVRRTPAKAVK